MKHKIGTNLGLQLKRSCMETLYL